MEWRCGGRAVPLDVPAVMAVLNVTPDSFSDGGAFLDPHAAVRRGGDAAAAGAAILDVGGESTRPGAEPVGRDEELARVLPVVAALAGSGFPVSIDTRHAEVAASCVQAGAVIINDVSGFRDADMIGVAAETEAGVVVMHMQGEPGTMQDAPSYGDVVAEVSAFLAERASDLESAGVARERIAIDPGIGFGKTLEHNVALIRGVGALSELGYPVVVGASRKRMIGELTGEEDPSKRLGGSLAAAVEAARRGASVLRVHDVVETVQALRVARGLWG